MGVPKRKWRSKLIDAESLYDIKDKRSDKKFSFKCDSEIGVISIHVTATTLNYALAKLEKEYGSTVKEVHEVKCKTLKKKVAY